MVTTNPDIGKYWYIGVLALILLGGFLLLFIEHIIIPEINKIIKRVNGNKDR